MNIASTIAALRDYVRALDPATLPPDEAVRLVDRFTELERIAVAGRTLAVGRVQQTRAWRGSGSPSIVAWTAARTGTTLGKAADTLNTALRLEQLPTTREALVDGRLSETQTSEIVAAAVADPGAEAPLLEMAGRESVAALRERCRDVRAAAAGDEDARERIRRGRYFKHWTDREGALRLDARLAPDDGAPLLAVIRARAEQLEAEGRRAGQAETREAYAADALCGLAGGEGAPRAIVNVLVSSGALERGRTEAGETCRIPGLGPISVAAARRFASAGSVRHIETDGVDVRRVSHAGRGIPSRLRSALEARDPQCVVPECNRRMDLEIDHIVPLAHGGLTELGNLARLCRWHHAQKTHHGWRLEGQPGDWRWVRRARGG